MIHLTGHNFNSKELIQNIFSPLIGTICSQQAEEICLKNNLTFVELLQPFCKLTNDVYLRDPSGSVNTIRGTRLNVTDVAWRPPQTLLARKILTESVTSTQCEETKTLKIDDKLKLEIPLNEPWFELWRETFLTVQFPADHEFTRHLLGCLIVVSSGELNPLENANQLSKKLQMMQNVTPPKLPKWFATSDILNCYVLLHDANQGGDVIKTQQTFESLKLTYGDNRCFLLQINSNIVQHQQQQQQQPQHTEDLWIKYLKRHPKYEGQPDQTSTPRTPQDYSGVQSMPNSVQSISLTDTPPSGIISMSPGSAGGGGTNEEMVDHPLSPVQEHASEAIHSNLSTSTDSLTYSNVLNPNVWAAHNEIEIESPHGQYLTNGDIENLKHFIQDFTVRSLVPYIERLVTILNDSIANKKGVSRSLLSATKRWFVTNKPGVNSMQNAVVYTNDSTELQTRKIGDIYFMFGNYNLAFQAYHQAKRDFNGDSAWQYYAGALEMAALSAFMCGTASRKTYDYMKEAIDTYLINCKLQQFATRATLLSLECLKTAKLHDECAKQLIRMTNEDSDLRSALLLEQAAYCFLQLQPTPFYHKYAFQIVLAGYRFSKAGQRKHAFRCYKQAYQVFECRGWSLAEDHIQYTIGKQAVTLKKLDEASGALAHLLRPSSLQSKQQQSAFLREYIATQKTLLQQQQQQVSSPLMGDDDNGGNIEHQLLLDISLPKIVFNSIRILVTSHPPLKIPNLISATNITINSNLDDEWKWQKLEEIIVQFVSKKQIMIFKPLRSLFTLEMPTNECPLSIHGEPIEISFILENTIKPSITFEDINILWTFHNESDGKIFTNRNLFKSDQIDPSINIYQIIASTYIKTLQLDEFERKTISMKLTPKFTGTLKIDGVVGRISATNEPSRLWGKLDFQPIPIKPELPQSIEKPIQYDKRLEITVLPPAPALNVSFTEIPQDVLAGEILRITIHLNNSGFVEIDELYCATENPRWILGDIDQELPLSILRNFKDLTNETLSRDKEARKQYAFQLLNGRRLKSNETITVPIWIQAPLRKGQTNIKLLIYYNTPDNYPKIRYRLVRHIWHLNVHESLSVDANCNIGNVLTNELGIDINAKNLNQVHHPLVTEINLCDLNLFCSKYKLNAAKAMYLQSPGYQKIFEKNCGLKSTDSLGLRIPLIEELSNELSGISSMNAHQFINKQLSNVIVTSLSENNSSSSSSTPIPAICNLGSFLMKHETKFIGIFGQLGNLVSGGGGSGNNEEFNNIIANEDKHMTVCLTWKAIISDNNSMQRQAYGQHFIQLRNLYETVYCPTKEKLQQSTTFANHEEFSSIYEFQNNLKTPMQNWNDELNDEWEENNVSVSRRCFLEVEEPINAGLDEIDLSPLAMVH